MTAAWGYVRLSQESDTSLDEQKASIREYASDAGLSLRTTVNDGKNTSGFNTDRSGYQTLREKIAGCEIDAVITRDRARLSREFDERLWLITTMRETGVEWHVTEERDRLYLEDVQRAMFECMHAGMDHYKKMIEIERSKDAVRKRIERGCFQGKPPIGLKFADDGCHLVKSDRWEEVQAAFEMIEAGATNARVHEVTGITNVSALRDRGLEYYADLLDEYGLEDA